jgi:hypothetical protein
MALAQSYHYIFDGVSSDSLALCIVVGAVAAVAFMGSGVVRR